MRVVAVVSAMGRAFEGGREVTLAVLLAPEIEALLGALAEAPLELPEDATVTDRPFAEA